MKNEGGWRFYCRSVFTWVVMALRKQFHQFTAYG